MRNWMKSAVAVAMAVALVGTTTMTPAEAGRGGNVAAGVVAGILVGGVIAGAVATSRPRYYTEPVNCGDYRRRAMADDRAGRPDRAQRWWDSYAACRAN